METIKSILLIGIVSGAAAIFVLGDSKADHRFGLMLDGLRQKFITNAFAEESRDTTIKILDQRRIVMRSVAKQLLLKKIETDLQVKYSDAEKAALMVHIDRAIDEQNELAKRAGDYCTSEECRYYEYELHFNGFLDYIKNYVDPKARY